MPMARAAASHAGLGSEKLVAPEEASFVPDEVRVSLGKQRLAPLLQS